MIVDNINRQRRVHKPGDPGETSTMMNGTASTLIELEMPEGVTVESAFNPAPIFKAFEQGKRRQLTEQVLHDQIKFGKIEDRH